jgi:hypothetical protein
MKDRHIYSNPEPEAARRHEIETEIIQQVREEVQEAILLHAPQSWKQDRREAVEENVLAESRMILDALSTNELGSTGALRSHIGRAIDEAKRLIRYGGVKTAS